TGNKISSRAAAMILLVFSVVALGFVGKVWMRNVPANPIIQSSKPVEAAPSAGAPKPDGNRSPSVDCSSNTSDRVASMLGRGDIERAYITLEQTSCPPADTGQHGLRVLKILISGSEVAAYHAIWSAVPESANDRADPGLSDLGAKAK